MQWIADNIRRGDCFRYGTKAERDEKLYDLEKNHGFKCLLYESDSQFWIRVAATPYDPGDPEELKEWERQKHERRK